MLRPSLTALNLRFPILALFAAASIFFLLAVHLFLRPSRDAYPVIHTTPGFFDNEGGTSTTGTIGNDWNSTADDGHPISTLVRQAQEQWRRLHERRAHDLESAINAYRDRRGRHPPPHFDKWFKFAQKHDALIVEDFFDQIYTDLNPFWAVEPQQIRLQAANMMNRVVVRDHKATTVTEGEHPWIPAWTDMIASIQDQLPDVIVPLNTMDESRVVVPYEHMRDYAAAERGNRQFVNTGFAIQSFTPLADHDFDPQYSFDPEFLDWYDGSYWEMVIRGCPEHTRGRRIRISAINFSWPPADFHNYYALSHQGYVKNVTRSRDLCRRPELQRLHGNFISPISVNTTHNLIPLFGSSKLAVNNEILLPAPMYWAEGTEWSNDGVTGGEWEDKNNTLMWRGAATGGRNTEDNWTGFHRHRFVAMVNGTAVGRTQSGDFPPVNFVRLDPDTNVYNLTSLRHGALGEFLNQHVEVGFMHLVCYPETESPHCPYDDAYFSIQPTLTFAEQFESKYLADMDSNSFSARYRNLLLSTTLPIKSTVYNEWHDARLVPWAHYVPMDATFMDIYGIMEYFMGTERTSDHDSVARKIALDGKAWAEKVLRKEDMQIYVYRLLLEYARVCDDQREYLGYIADIKPRK